MTPRLGWRWRGVGVALGDTMARMTEMPPYRALPRERWNGWRTLEECTRLVCRHDRGESYRQIGADLGVSYQRVQQLIARTRTELAARLHDAERRMARAAVGEAELVARRDARLGALALEHYRDYRLRTILLELPPTGSVWPRAEREAFLARLWAVIEERSGQYWGDN